MALYRKLYDALGEVPSAGSRVVALKKCSGLALSWETHIDARLCAIAPRWGLGTPKHNYFWLGVFISVFLCVLGLAHAVGVTKVTEI